MSAIHSGIVASSLNPAFAPVSSSGAPQLSSAPAVHQNGDGSYDVTFAGALGKTKTMSLDQLVSDMTAPDAGGLDYTEV